MDLDKTFDYQVWRNVYIARGALEAASYNAGKLGYPDLDREIHAVKEQTLTLLARCAELAKQDIRRV